jgi:hypothetical protein
MRINNPHFTLLEDGQQVLVLRKIQTNDDVFEGFVDLYSGEYLAFVAEEHDILNGGIVFPESQYLSFIRSDSNGSAKGRHCHKHILVIKPTEPFPESVFRE